MKEIIVELSSFSEYFDDAPTHAYWEVSEDEINEIKSAQEYMKSRKEFSCSHVVLSGSFEFFDASEAMISSFNDHKSCCKKDDNRFSYGLLRINVSPSGVWISGVPKHCSEGLTMYSVSISNELLFSNESLLIQF